jgi:hypothetical protein
LLQTGKELTTTEEKCSLKGAVTLNIDGSILKICQTRAVAFLAQNKDFQSLYCGMTWPIQQDSSLVEAIKVCITIQTALKESDKVDTITMQTDNNNFVELILKEKERIRTGKNKKPTDKPIDKLITWVVDKLEKHKSLKMTYVPRIQNIAANEYTLYQTISRRYHFLFEIFLSIFLMSILRFFFFFFFNRYEYPKVDSYFRTCGTNKQGKCQDICLEMQVRRYDRRNYM